MERKINRNSSVPLIAFLAVLFIMITIGPRTGPLPASSTPSTHGSVVQISGISENN